MSTSTDAAGPGVASPAPANDTITAAPYQAPVDVATQEQSLPPTKPQVKAEGQAQSGFLHSPPDSNNNPKSDASDSELSDLDEEPILSDAPMPAPPSEADKDDIGEVLPDHWSGTVPVFKPTMDQFKDFKRFMEAVDSYGMKSGIIKIIPPDEWKNDLPALDELVKRIKVREPIKQDIMGSSGTYRQVNILHGRSYNVPQWRQLCEQSEHQPPARRGERRANAERTTRSTRPRPAAVKPANTSTAKKRGRGRPAKAKQTDKGKDEAEAPGGQAAEDRPMTPVSPKQDAEEEEKPVESIEKELGEPVDEDDHAPTVGRMGVVRPAKAKTQSVSARRKNSRREGSAMIDEAAFKDWDYRMDISEFTPERCEELERVYWKTLTYAQPLYGADLMGTLFDESTELWNLNKLPNLLDVLGTKVPGVNTAYLYLGMWKATFAWHLEDVDLYSINYLHFGAPKQWYSISQADARRFEAAMKSIWPQDAKACDQFLRHKAFLISPQHLLSRFGIKVNKCLSYPGEFVVTYPYGYHSGYNLGYNCAEAVNFALDSWLDMGKIAKKCDCAQAQDSVWVNVYEIERKMRGEETEYEETEDEDDGEDELSGLPTPPAGHGVKFKEATGKRKRGLGEKGGNVKKIKLRIKTKAEPPCCLCPNDFPISDFLPTDDGRKAHRLCALYLPETYIDVIDGKEIVSNAAHIHKDRVGLKCMFCRSKRGACFQCSQKKCARAYHATCAAAAGVFVEEQDVPVFGEDGTEYKEQAFEFNCRFHRTKRDRKFDGDALESDPRIRSAAAALKKGEICQMQFLKGDIFAGCVVENRPDDQSLLLDILPSGDRVEVEWKWLLLPDAADYRLPKASANALPMPTSRKAKDELNVKRKQDEAPRKDDIFAEGYTWAEFQLEQVSNKNQVKVDFAKTNQIWYYLGKTSTELRAQYTEDASNPRHNPQGNFLDTIPKPPRPAPPPRVQQQPPYIVAGSYPHPYATAVGMPAPSVSARPEKPYIYKPRKPVKPNFAGAGMFTAQQFAPPTPSMPATQQFHKPVQQPAQQPVQQPAQQSVQQPIQQQYVQQTNAQNQGFRNAGTFSTQRFEVRTPQTYMQMQQTRAPTAPAPSAQVHSAQAYSVPSAPAPATSAMMARPQQNQWSMPSTAPIPAGRANVPYSPVPASAQQQQPARVQPRPQIKASWQVHSSIYQKYQFFQVNHNRDSGKYRTPYSPWGGFTNGYEGNLRAHLMNNQHELLRRAGLGTGAQPQQNYAANTQLPQNPSYTPRPVPQAHAQPRPPSQPQAHAHAHASPYSTSPFGQSPRPGLASSPPSVASTPAPATPATPIAPYPHQHGFAMKAQWAVSPQPPQQTSQPAVHVQAHPGKPKPILTQPQKSYKIPPKESPVPLPANFLAAMTSAPTTPVTATHGASPQVQPANLTEAKAPNQTSQLGQKQSASPPGKQTPAAVLKVSTTPVPIPHLPGMSSHMTAAPHPPATGGQTQEFPPPVLMPSLGHGQSSTGPSQVQNPPSATAHQQQAEVHASGPNTEPHGFPDVPGGESMEFVERLMQNLRKVSQRDGNT